MKVTLTSTLPGGHGECVLAVTLVGELQLPAVLVGDGNCFRRVAAVGLYCDRHGAAAGGIFRADGHGAVLRFVGCGHGIAWGGIAGTSPNQSIDRVLNGFCHCIYLALLGNVLVADDSIKGCFHSGKISVIVETSGLFALISFLVQLDGGQYRTRTRLTVFESCFCMFCSSFLCWRCAVLYRLRACKF